MTDADHRARVARKLNQHAAILKLRGWPEMETIYQAVRLLLEDVAEPEPARPPDQCAGCDATLPLSRGPRPRKWCSEPCRSRFRRRPD